MKNKKAQLDGIEYLFVIIVIFLVFLVLLIASLGMNNYFKASNFCRSSGGEFTTSRDCLKGETIYSIKQVNQNLFNPKFKLARLGVSEK